MWESAEIIFVVMASLFFCAVKASSPETVSSVPKASFVLSPFLWRKVVLMQHYVRLGLAALRRGKFVGGRPLNAAATIAL
jgi:hypothetical protein